MRLAFLSTLLILSSSLPSTITASDSGVSPADVEFFEKRIRPLLVSRCYECHSAGAKQLQAGLRLDSREAMLARPRRSRYWRPSGSDRVRRSCDHLTVSA